MNTSAGIISKLRRCTPMLNPIRKAMSTTHLREFGRSARSYHIVMSQNTAAVNRDDIA